ncbi:MAG: hypothetical protein KatS3mg110_4047 [Pirellulaceae bacterium]|nr:MAG: hypothetical protein KatS3mg110_4047 [Pirellulaceae bacterium]
MHKTSWQQVRLLCGLLLAAGCSSFGSHTPEPFYYSSVKTPERSEQLAAMRQTWEKRAEPALASRKSGTSKGLLGSDGSAAWWSHTDPDQARQEYAAGESLYRQAMQLGADERGPVFHEASRHFLAAAKKWPDSSLEQDALFLAGEALFFADRYAEANDVFGRLLKKHPQCRYLDVVEARRFVIAQYWLAAADYYGDSFWTVNLFDRRRPWRDTRGHALKIFDRIRIDDPTGKLADDATLAAANAYFLAGKYISADQYYTDLRKTFPTSEHQFTAHLMGVYAKLASYDGPDYSGVPLTEAEELLKQIRRQFPAEYQKHREELERLYGEVRYRQAERHWQTARYYEKQRAYGGARFYYELVAADFPETPFAAQARQRMEEIAGLPSRPPQKLEWLVQQFPSRHEEKPLVATGAPPSVKR